MGTQREEQRAYLGYVPGAAFVNSLQDIAIAASKNLVVDGKEWGVIEDTGEVIPTSPDPSLAVVVEALEGYTSYGEHFKRTTSTTCSLLYEFDGDTQGAAIGTGVWVALFAKMGWTYSDPRTDDLGSAVYFKRTEDVTFVLKKGTADKAPANPGAGAIRLCNIWIPAGATQVTAANIKQSTLQARGGYRERDTWLPIGRALRLGGPGAGRTMDANRGIWFDRDDAEAPIAASMTASHVRTFGDPIDYGDGFYCTTGEFRHGLGEVFPSVAATREMQWDPLDPSSSLALAIIEGDIDILTVVHFKTTVNAQGKLLPTGKVEVFAFGELSSLRDYIQGNKIHLVFAYPSEVVAPAL